MAVLRRASLLLCLIFCKQSNIIFMLEDCKITISGHVACDTTDTSVFICMQLFLYRIIIAAIRMFGYPT